MAKLRYMPKLSVEISDNVSIPLYAEMKQDGYHHITLPDERFEFLYGYDDKRHTFKNTHGQVRDELVFRVEKPVTIPIVNHRQNYKMPVDVYPDVEVSKKLYERVGKSSIVPTIIPPAYKEVDEIVDYLFENDLYHDINHHGIMDTFVARRYVNLLQEDNTTALIDTNLCFDSKARYYNPRDARATQEEILHLIVLNEFIGYAEKEDNYSLTLGEYIDNNDTNKHVKQQFEKFEITENSHTFNLIDFLLENIGISNHPLKLSILRNSKRRKCMRYLTARAVIDCVKANVRDYDKNNIEEIEYYKTFRVGMKEDAFGIENTLIETFRLFNKPNDSNDLNVFDVVDTMHTSNMLLGKRVSHFFEMARDENSGYDVDSVKLLRNSKVLFELTDSRYGASNNEYLAIAFRLLGYDYLSNHIRPTNLAVLHDMFYHPGDVFPTENHLNHVLKFMEKNIDNEDSDNYIVSRDYICDLLYHLSIGYENVKLNSRFSTLDLREASNNFSMDDVPVEFVLDIIVNEKDKKSDKDKYTIEPLNYLRLIGM